jgi:hypothetical protein
MGYWKVMEHFRSTRIAGRRFQPGLVDKKGRMGFLWSIGVVAVLMSVALQRVLRWTYFVEKERGGI